MANMSTEHMDALNLDTDERLALIEHPTRPGLYFKVMVDVEVLDTRPENANLGRSRSTTINAKALMQTPATQADLDALDAMSAHFSLTTTQIVRRWGKVLALLLDFIKES